MRLPRLALAWWPELLLGALAIGMVLADGFRNYAGDPDVFYRYAQLVGRGQLPFLGSAFEYPPLAIIPMALPYLLGGAPTIALYRPLLFFQNVALIAAIGVGVVWLARRGAARETPLRSLVVYVLMAVALEPVITWRVDTAVTALTVVALIMSISGRTFASGIAVGAAVMTKLYPVAMLPILALGHVRGRHWLPGLALVGVATLTAAVIAVALMLVAGTPSLYFVQYEVTRGTQIESVPGALTFLAAIAGLADVSVSHAFGSMQVASAMLAPLEPVMTVVTVGGIAAGGLAVWHRYRADCRAHGAFQASSQAAYLTVVGLLVLVTSRVLSPQYIFWIVPFAALLDRRKALALLVACLLTTLVYPLNYQQFIDVAPLPVLVVNLRNAILVTVFLWLILPDLFAFARAVVSRRSRGL